jgi:hypothetical protein
VDASSLAEAPAADVPKQGAAALDSELAAEARGLVQDFAARLKGALETAIKDGGPTAAVEVCNQEAPQIADALSAETGWAVARTSLKHRNPANAPDDWERGVLRAFETRQADGEDAKGMTFTATLSEDDGRQFRFMQAIPTAPVCLVCHGDSIPDEVASAIDDDLLMDYARKLAGRGLNATILEPRGNTKFHRLAIADFESLNDAAVAAEQHKSEFGSEGWVTRY